MINNNIRKGDVMTQYKYGDDHTKPTHHKDRKEVNIFDIMMLAERNQGGD